MEQELRESPRKKKTSRLLILAAILVIGAFFGIRAYIHAQHHETTDNAQLDATITSVRSAVTGFVAEVRFEENQRVKKGDTLAVIDNKDYLAKVLQAKAMLQSALAQTGVSRVSSEAAMQSATASSLNTNALQANIDAARARLSRAEKELARIQSMFSQGAATQQQLDAVRAEQQTAKAQHELALRQYQASLAQTGGVKVSAQAQKQQVGVSSALVQQRQAELQLTESQLANTVITAPYDGVVSKKAIEVGQLVQAGQPVCSAVETGELWVTANFKETQLTHMKPGEKARIELDAYPDLELTGTIESIGAATGAKFSLLPPDNATGNYVKVTQRIPVRIKLDRIESKQYALAPGLSANVDVEIQ